MYIENTNGVWQYPRADSRRLFVLLAAIDRLERPTLTSISNYIGHNKGTIDSDVAKLNEQFGVIISKAGPVYSIESWGEILNKIGVLKISQRWKM